MKSSVTSVTVDNFTRAESDLYFNTVVKKNGFGRFEHNGEMTPIDQQTVIRMNRDTIYSAAVLGLDGGCNDKSVNCLPIVEGCNYMVRLIGHDQKY